MKEIGGYFELELNRGKEYHTNAIRLNSGKNCLEYILTAKHYKKIYIPYYTCEVVYELCKKLGLEYEFYSIDRNLDPIFDMVPGPEEVFLYTNYFGIKEHTVHKLVLKYKNLIIDNAQAFFSVNLEGVDSFYSARKFFGVPDGAYLYTDKLLPGKLVRDISVGRLLHLIKRIDEGAEAGYNDFKNNEDTLGRQTVKSMSSVTHALLCNINYSEVIKCRKQNFHHLHKYLKDSNLLEISDNYDFVPMVYPFLSKKSGLRDHLISKKIFVAKYWPGLVNWLKEESFEYFLATCLVPLPVDQRYNLDDMKRVALKVIDYV